MSPDTSSTAGAAGQPAVDTQHPWLGLASFTEETRGYFYGREDEVAELARRVQRKLLTILFGQSGLGKTSILRAGIVPRLRPEGYCPVYVRIDYSPESPAPSEQIKQAIFRETQQSGEWTQTGVAASGESLWEFLHHRDDVLRDASGRTLIPLLIFDQFEEIFTLAQSDDFGRQRAAQFLADLADLVENRAPKALEERIEHDEAAADRFDFARADYRILIALREDYLAHLEGLKGSMPSITQNRMRLARMTGAQALSAVLKPGGRLVSEEVAAAIVRFVAGGSELANAEVEPSLLSLICRELNNARLAQGRDEISADLLAGSRDTILTEFYERALADQPAGVRQVIEDHLLTESGYRESLAEERLVKLLGGAGAPPGTLAKLVDRRLLRIEERLDVRRVELTHDVLCGVVKASRDVRLEREARDEAERQLAAQRARELATKQALVRARQIAIGCAALAVVAAGGAIFGYVSTKRAQEAELKAQQTRQMADASRGEAEKLIVYLLDDFYLELEPVGRLDIVGDLSRRALDYYGALPPELRTAETNRNRALALVRYGIVLRTQSKIDESDKALSEAVDVLGKMRSDGDQSEATAMGLGVGLMAKARVLDSRNHEAEAGKTALQAVEVLRPLIATPNPSVALRRAYGLCMNYLGYWQMANDQEEAGVRTLLEAREVQRGIDGLKVGDLPSAVAYSEATGWLANALQSLGRHDEARRIAEEGLAVTGQVLEKRPGHMVAIRARALMASSLANSEADTLHVARAIALSEAQARDWEAMVRIDPTNQISLGNLIGSRHRAGNFLQRIGRVRESLDSLRAALALEPKSNAASHALRNLFFTSGDLANLEVDLGNRQASEAARKEQARFAAMATRNLPPEAFERFLFAELGQGFYGYSPAVAAADYESVRGMAVASIRRIENLAPRDGSQELWKDRLLVNSQLTLADALYNLREYEAASREIRTAIELRKRLPKRTLQDERDAGDELIVAAMIAARQGNFAEAQRIIEPVVKFHRGLYARGKDNDDLTQHVQLAQALYASALAAEGRKGSQLAEAAAILDGLPPAMRGRVSIALWRNRITEEQKKRT
jgi:tetratricopeptide (TPR) repeat protein